MELSNYLVSWVVNYLGDLQPTYIGVIIYLLSTMDILVDIMTSKNLFCLTMGRLPGDLSPLQGFSLRRKPKILGRHGRGAPFTTDPFAPRYDV